MVLHGTLLTSNATELNSDLFQYQNNNVKIRFVSDSNGDVGIVLTHGVNNRNAIIKLADNNFRIDYTNASGVWNNAVTWELK